MSTNLNDIIANSQISQLEESISEKIPGNSELQEDLTKQVLVQEEEEVFSVKNNFMIREKRDLQNYVNTVANDMDVENHDMQKVLLSYSAMMQLNQKIQKQQEESDAYGMEGMKKKVIEDFVKQKTEENVKIRDQNAGKKQNKKGSKNSGKNAKVSGTKKKKNNQKKEMSYMGKEFLNAE